MKSIILSVIIFFILCNFGISQNFTIVQNVTGQNNLTDIRGQSFTPSVQGLGSGDIGEMDTVYLLRFSLIYSYLSYVEADTLYIYSSIPDSIEKLDNNLGGLLIGKSFLKSTGTFPYTDYLFDSIPLHKDSIYFCLFREDINLEASAGGSYAEGCAFRNRADTLNYNDYLDLKFVAELTLEPALPLKAFIPDTNLRAFLYSNYSNCMDPLTDSLLIDVAAQVSGTVDCNNSNISDLTGIEYFTNIQNLNCRTNNLSGLPDLSNISNLRGLSCYQNQITELPDLSKNTQLENLICSSNQLLELPALSNNIELEVLSFHSNQISEFPDLTNNVNLKEINCSFNQIEALPNLSANANLEILSVGHNNLTELPELSNHLKLKRLFCQENQLNSLPDLSNNMQLQMLLCYDNNLESLPSLDMNTELLDLYCYSNKLIHLPDLSNSINLEQIRCENNLLDSLPSLSTNTKLRNLFCQDNQLKKLPSLLTNIELDGLNCENNQLVSLPDLSYNINLGSLECSLNQLTSLPNFANNGKLIALNCNNNQITILPDFSSQNNLQRFNCRYNKLDFSDVREVLIIDALPLMKEFIYSPQNDFGISDSISICNEEDIVLTILKQDSASSYQWYKNNTPIEGAVDTFLIVQKSSQTGTYRYTCRTSGSALESPPLNFGPGISEFESEEYIVITNIPELYVSTFTCCLDGNPVLLAGNPQGGEFSGTGVIGSLFYPDSAGAGMHQIVYSYTYPNGCELTDTNTITVENCEFLSLNNEDYLDVKIFPNPASQYIQVEGSGFQKLEIYNLFGIKLIQSHEQRVGIACLPEGEYLIKIWLEEKNYIVDYLIKEN